MRVTYRLAFEDYYDAYQARTAKRRRVRELLLLAITVLLCAAWIRTENRRVGQGYLVLGVMFLLSLPAARWLNKISFENAYRRGASDSSGKEFTVDISEDGIQVPHTPHKENWSCFSKYSESGSAFILYRSSSIHAILPKRAFEAGDIDSFRRLLRGKLARL